MLKSKLRKSLLALFCSSFGDIKNDELWVKWLNLLHGEGWMKCGHFRGMIASTDFADEFKARALMVLFTPELENLPIPWPRTEETERNYVDRAQMVMGLEEVPKSLRLFFAGLITICLEYVRGSSNPEVRMKFGIYNSMIPSILPRLPDNDPITKRLFDNFKINDDVSDPGNGDLPNYVFFYLLMLSRASEKWKTLAETVMRMRIADGARKALSSYVNHLENSVCDQSSYRVCMMYGRKRTTDQIEFLLSLPNTEHIRLFGDTYEGCLLEFLIRHRNWKLLHKLARRLVLGEKEQFQVNDDRMCEIARTIAGHFAKTDDELLISLTRRIEQYQKEKNYRQHQEAQEAGKAREILDQMKP